MRSGNRAEDRERPRCTLRGHAGTGHGAQGRSAQEQSPAHRHEGGGQEAAPRGCPERPASFSPFPSRPMCEAKSAGGDWASDGFGGDAELAAGGRAWLPDDDVDVAPKRCQEAEQTFERVLAEVAPQEPGHVGL